MSHRRSLPLLVVACVALPAWAEEPEPAPGQGHGQQSAEGSGKRDHAVGTGHGGLKAGPHKGHPDGRRPKGHAHGRRFTDAERWAKEFESRERDKWQRPASVIAALKLRGDERVLDIGSATGYFTVRLARAVPRGRVYGVDIEESMQRYLAERAQRESLSNLKAILGAADDPRLQETVDLVFICNTYHHLPDRSAYFRGIAGRLRYGGRVVVVDFKGGKLPLGPPEEERVLPPQLESELVAAGFARLSLDEKLLPFQYVAVYGAVPPKLPSHPDRACKRDADCALRGETPCSCPPCSNRWREPLNRAALARWQGEWARRRCQMPACAECPVEGERLGRRAVCKSGQCAVE